MLCYVTNIKTYSISDIDPWDFTFSSSVLIRCKEVLNTYLLTVGGILRDEIESDGSISSEILNLTTFGVFQWGHLSILFEWIFSYHLNNHLEWNTWDHSFVTCTLDFLSNFSKHIMHLSSLYWASRWLILPWFMEYITLSARNFLCRYSSSIFFRCCSLCLRSSLALFLYYT